MRLSAGPVNRSSRRSQSKFVAEIQNPKNQKNPKKAKTKAGFLPVEPSS